MKSNVKFSNAPKAYPYLGHYKYEPLFEQIVLFTSPYSGVVVKAIGDRTNLGEYSVEWAESEFESFNGTIELSN